MRDSNASLPGLPEDALIGEMYNEKEPMSVDVVIGNTTNSIFNGTGLSPGDHLTNLVGYEADQLYFNAPVGTQQITHSPYTFTDGTLNFSDITLYQAKSGAAVFATGSMQWNWGLAQGVQSTSFVSPAARRMMTNMLARLITPPTPPSAYVGLRGAATASTSTASSRLNVGAPAGLVANDVMLAQVAVRGGTNTGITAPAGWNLVRLDNQGTSIAQAIYSHVVSDPTAEPSSYAWNFSSSNNAAGAIIAYYGVSNVAPVDISGGQGNASSTKITAPALVVPGGDTGDLLVAFFSTATATGFTLPTPTLPRWSFGASSGGIGVAASDLLLNSDGTTGNEIATATNAAPNIGALIALLPQSAAAPTPTAGATVSVTPAATPGGATPTPGNTPIPTTASTLTPAATPIATPAPTATATTRLVSLRGVGTGSTAAVSTQLIVKVPGGVQPNDLMIAQIAVRGGTGIAITPPSGWNLVRRDNFSTTIAQAIYSHLVPASPSEPASYIWNFSGSNDAAGGIAAYFGASVATPVDASNGQGNSSSTSITAPSIAVPAGDNQDLLLGLFAIANSSAVTVAPASTARWSFHATGGGIGVAASDQQLGSSGPTGNLIAAAGSAANNVGALVALLPAQTGAPTPTPTAAPTASGTPGATASATATSTNTATPTPTAVPTNTPTVTPSPTATPTNTATPTPTALPTDTPTATPSPTASVIITPPPTASPSPTASATAAATSTATATPSPAPTSIPITLRSSLTASTAALSTQLAIGVPTGVQANDLLIAEIAVRGGSRLAITAPSAWTLVRRDDSSSSVAQAIYQHVVPNSPPEPSSYTWTFSTANDAAGGILAYVGASTVTPIDASNGQGNASSTSITAPSTTIPALDTSDLLIGIFSIANSSSVTVPAGMVQRWSFHATGGGIGVAASDLQLGSAGGTGNQIATAATAAANAGALLALAPR
ncbi:MAG TPA: N,N-dimethylformamidase beta subunit family domain-containing protein [Candidatus Binataceae bacterium]|nr:N,N-dimethylformamidase beta subunit family domain-containing protein [Candidatus Binataceae bacterium]